MKLHDLEGKVLDDRFELVQLLGEGGYGAVFEAVQLSVKRRCAIKVISPALCAKKATQQRFRTEARATSQLTHPNSVVVFDFGRDEVLGLSFIAMEFLEGRDLSRVLREDGTLPVETAVHIATQVSGSLQEAHELGLVHRDIKPLNIMLVARGDDPWFVKVIDFGLAKVLREDLMTIPDPTQANAAVGTPKYMSPEEISNEPVDGRADQYALATCLYEMLVGRTPFTDGTPMEVATAHLAATPKPLRAFRPQLPVSDAFEQVLLRALAKTPDERFPTMREFAATLAEAAEMEPDFAEEDLRATLQTSSVSEDLEAQQPAAAPQPRAGRRHRRTVPLAELEAEQIGASPAGRTETRPRQGVRPVVFVALVVAALAVVAVALAIPLLLGGRAGQALADLRGVAQPTTPAAATPAEPAPADRGEAPASPAASPAAIETPGGTLVIVSTTPASKMHYEGSYVGDSPLQLDLAPGEYVVVFEADGRRYPKVLEVPDAPSTHLRFDLGAR